MEGAPETIGILDDCFAVTVDVLGIDTGVGCAELEERFFKLAATCAAVGGLTFNVELEECQLGGVLEAAASRS